MNEGIVIVGGGQCAAQVVDALRRGGFEGPLTLVTDEPHLPYQRPPLSKQFLAGEIPVERVLMRPATYYAERGVTLRLGNAAKRIDRERGAVELADGSSVAYADLVLATGARPRRLTLPGHALANVLDLRTIADVERIREQLSPGRRLVVVGGGFIGLEVAATTRKMGLEVTVLEAADRLMARVLSPLLSSWFESLHRDHGVQVVTGAKVEGFEGEQQVEAVRCSEGRYPADLVVVGIGVLPNQEIAERAGIACDDGILVDTACRTSDPHVLAAGDCTRHPSTVYRRSLRLESVQNAVSQARVAAASALGQEACYDELPWFWSDQYDTKLQMAGLSQGHDHSVLRGDAGGSSFSVFYLRDSTLIAADVINNTREFMACRKLLARQPRVDPARLADPAVALDSLAG